MSDYYTEQLVKQKTKTSSIFIKIGLVAVTVLSFLSVLMIPMGIIVPIIMIVIDMFVFRRLDLEFEYLYVNGELDIDKIMSKQKRKKVFSTDVKGIEVLAPSGSAELRPYQKAKVYNFSSGEEGNKTYELVTNENGQVVRVIFEPNETILEGMRMLAPRKVFI